MTNAKREEIIAAMSSLLEQLVDSEPPKAEPTTAPLLTLWGLGERWFTLR